MSMNPRLLRPRQSLHPEAAAWAARVVANGGTVSGTTLSAVSKFCAAIDAAGLRSRFLRVNLFCGGPTPSNTAVGLNSALVPLYRGPSLGGTQYGGTIDTNSGTLFAGANYNETGASGGLTSSGSMWLNTGIQNNFAAQNNTHLAAYESLVPSGAFKAMLGVDNLAGTPRSIYYLGMSSTTRTDLYSGSTSNLLFTSATRVAGFWIGSMQASRSDLFFNGTAVVSQGFAATGAGSGTTPTYYVFANNRDGNASDGFLGGRLNGYSIGLGMDAAQASAYNTAMQAFQTALGRNV